MVKVANFVTLYCAKDTKHCSVIANFLNFSVSEVNIYLLINIIYYYIFHASTQVWSRVLELLVTALLYLVTWASGRGLSKDLTEIDVIKRVLCGDQIRWVSRQHSSCCHRKRSRNMVYMLLPLATTTPLLQPYFSVPTDLTDKFSFPVRCITCYISLTIRAGFSVIFFGVTLWFL